jgi:predicted nucleic acid-binding protein
MKFFFDSSAWIEYLEGSEKGEKVKDILKGDNDVFSIPLVISEVVSKVKRSGKDTDICFKAIISNSKIFNLTPEIAKEVGILHAEIKKKKRDFGLADATIWVCAKKLDSKLITCDHHFKDFGNLLLLD